MDSAGDENVDELQCPSDYDPSVWNFLPSSIQKEIISDNMNQTTAEIKMNMEPQPTEMSFKSEQECPKDVDPEIFNQLPREIQVEILNNEKAKSSTIKVKRSKVNKIENYFSVKSKGT